MTTALEEQLTSSEIIRSAEESEQNANVMCLYQTGFYCSTFVRCMSLFKAGRVNFSGPHTGFAALDQGTTVQGFTVQHMMKYEE